MTASQENPRIGMIVPSGNILAEEQVRAMLPDEVGLHITRLKLTGSSDADLDAMIDHLPCAAELLADARVNLIAFNCTAVSTRSAVADEKIASLIAAQTGVAAVTTAEALRAGLVRLDAKRIVLITPYIRPVVEREAAFFRHHNFDILASVGADINSNWDMAHAEASVWRELTHRHRNDDADAYVLSCTAIRTAELIGGLESELRRPVLTSNQAIAWYAARRVGARTPVTGYGTLLEHY